MPEEYVYHVRIFEFQAWNNIRGGEIRPYAVLYTAEYDVSNEMQIVSAFHSKCASAAISSCDIHTVKVLDEQGNVWRDLSATFYHAQEVSE